ncbi:NAD(P)-dependent dehydrogenase (short-subunit alcohol dehydrogenase family) [Inquilinus ginsengisoli]|uniref:NAD(P)-dependent dehydrogenase (Short-subunit alcohol dehydrogenase family) n=1 Tax=Inquilinus ginsengisoli TaxID=363840 RepID=A0ABU1JKI6_9PROT|nr:short chain dehydrogenase [Inquilinus ginsengisoli]MDR6289127.1 NAD(P)-dependent dehydrogenase (short-subunit alcohol dehydrogenase family) [Inquilinus ginsengisoli]
MRVIVIGATGTIGSAVAAALETRHEVVRASHRGTPAVDIEDPDSITALLQSVGEIDAVACCAASAPMASLVSASDAAFTQGLQGKLLGQVALLRRALHHLRDGGSVTLTSGAFARPTPDAAFGALVNAGIEAFVRAAAVDLPRGLRVNCVSPGWVRETLLAMGLDGADGTPAATVARAYVAAVEGTMTGQVMRPGAARNPSLLVPPPLAGGG